MARYLVTGGAGFIGSNMARALVARGEQVRVLDDFSTGRRINLGDIARDVEVVEGSICDPDVVKRAMTSVAYCLHLAAIPSVPRSVADPLRSNRVNVEGSLNVILAARDAGVRRVVYASSSSVYGNAPPGRLVEDLPRAPVSPYGVSKAATEMYAETFNRLYDLELVGLRYFNVFGPRQDPDSPYAAVIPIFIRALRAGLRPPVHGDGRQSRDFTYVDNVVEANLRACACPERIAGVYNVACGATASVLDLVATLNSVLGTRLEPEFLPARPGDIRDSQADIRRAGRAFGYAPQVSLREGLERTVAWYKRMEDTP
ncbi:MAG TPA: SDR family oxidoreductase [Candidatus Hydrogenedentes bacterium]|nr:SDR family oxidoreductase [Candidatus Hydrogenedentota bacterium]HNT88953.1 SDR family oxidoreductase [Candidatus Hydrogenedentota bacterium]